jgi:hypothetical protein
MRFSVYSAQLNARIPFLGAFATSRKATVIFMPTWNNSAPTGRIFIKFDTGVFFENLSRKFKFH